MTAKVTTGWVVRTKAGRYWTAAGGDGPLREACVEGPVKGTLPAGCVGVKVEITESTTWKVVPAPFGAPVHLLATTHATRAAARKSRAVLRNGVIYRVTRRTIRTVRA